MKAWKYLRERQHRVRKRLPGTPAQTRSITHKNEGNLSSTIKEGRRRRGAMRTSGSVAQVASYRRKNASPSSPHHSGARTWGEDHGAVTPPQVNATVQQVVLEMINKFPLE
jgi:hypothetical protein